MSFESLDGGRLTVASEYLPLLRARDLDTFDKVMAVPGGKPMRDFPGRRTVRLELGAGSGAVQAVFLKRYEPEYLSAGRRWLRRLGWPSAQDEAWREWQGIQAVRALGIETAAPMAVGQTRRGGLVTHSFLMTAEIVGGVEGGPYAQQLAPAARRRFLGQVASLARRFHEAGWVHKDLYISHVLAVPPVTPDQDALLFLIDLQRVIKPCCRRERWMLKDLGALAYSALKSAASPRDLLCGYLEYCGKRKLTEPDRATARKILRRVAWLKTRTPKHDKGFQQLV